MFSPFFLSWKEICPLEVAVARLGLIAGLAINQHTKGGGVLVFYDRHQPWTAYLWASCYMKERKKYNLFKLRTNNTCQAKLVGFFCQKAFLTGLASLKENFTRLLQTVLFYSVAPQVWRQSAEKNLHWMFLVDQRLRICLPRQGTWVWSLAWGDSTCHGATKPASHNYWACMLQLVKPCT